MCVVSQLTRGNHELASLEKCLPFSLALQLVGVGASSTLAFPFPTDKLSRIFAKKNCDFASIISPKSLQD
jgi:hypothetical protein